MIPRTHLLWVILPSLLLFLFLRSYFHLLWLLGRRSSSSLAQRERRRRAGTVQALQCQLGLQFLVNSKEAVQQPLSSPRWGCGRKVRGIALTPPATNVPGAHIYTHTDAFLFSVFACPSSSSKPQTIPFQRGGPCCMREHLKLANKKRI